MDLLRAVGLVAATGTTGLMAGVFFAFSVAVMPGLRRTGDRTFVGAFQAVDRAIINPLFLSVFLAPLLTGGLAVLLHLPSQVRGVLPWTVVAFALYLATFVITVRVHVPRNDEIKAAGDPDRIADLAAVRARFDEARWRRWNHVRTVLCGASLVLFACALLAR